MPSDDLKLREPGSDNREGLGTLCLRQSRLDWGLEVAQRQDSEPASDIRQLLGRSQIKLNQVVFRGKCVVPLRESSRKAAMLLRGATRGGKEFVKCGVSS